ncbi:hypothetical protein MRX96_053207 [Rhipicephalus microplus]
MPLTTSPFLVTERSAGFSLVVRRLCAVATTRRNTSGIPLSRPMSGYSEEARQALGRQEDDTQRTYLPAGLSPTGFRNVQSVCLFGVDAMLRRCRRVFQGRIR